MALSLRVRRALVCGALFLFGGSIGGCTANPRQLAYLNDQMTQAADAIGDVRVNLSLLQSSIDSLKLVVARQDSTIARLAAVTNVQIVK